MHVVIYDGGDRYTSCDQAFRRVSQSSPALLRSLHGSAVLISTGAEEGLLQPV